MAGLTMPVMAPVAAPAMGVSPTYTGLYLSIVYIGAVLSSLAAGSAVKRFGAIRVSQFGLLLCAAGLALCAVPSLPVVALGALLIGCGYGPITPASSHLLALTTPAHRLSLVFSIKQTGVPVGGMLAGALVPGVMLLIGWQSALLAVAAANLLCVVVAQPLRPGLDADRQDDHPVKLGNLLQPLRIVFSHRALALLALCSFAFSTVQQSLTGYLVTYLHESLAYGLVAAGLALSVAQIGGVAGRIAWGYVSDRWMSARPTLAMLAALMAMGGIATALLTTTMPTFLVLAILLVFGASGIGWNGVYLAEVARQAPPGMASIATGGTLAVTFFGVVLGPPVFGAISGIWGSYRAGFAALAVPTLICCFALLRAKR